MIYKVMLLGKTLARFKDDFESARDYADLYPTEGTVEVYEDGNLVFLKWN